MRTFAVVAAVVALLLGPIPAHAQAGCAPGVVRQDDMAGVYVNPESPMRVEIWPCGGSYVQWENAYGTHRAAYATYARFPSGGVVAVGMAGQGPYLDDSYKIGFKPAEQGYIQVVTLGVYDETYRVYRLKKIG